MIIFVHFYFPFSVHCYIIIYSIEVIRKITPTSVTLDKIKFICQRNDEEDYYKKYFENDSSIVNNSINLLNNYAELLSERKDGIS